MRNIICTGSCDGALGEPVNLSKVLKGLIARPSKTEQYHSIWAEASRTASQKRKTNRNKKKWTENAEIKEKIHEISGLTHRWWILQKDLNFCLVWRKLKIAPYFAHSNGRTWHWTLTITLHTALCVIMVVVGVESLIRGTNLECLPKMLTSYFRSMASTIHVWRGWTQSQKWQKWILGMLPEIPPLTTLTEEHRGSITDETVKDINSLVSLHSEERLLCCESSVLMHSVAIRGTILETSLSVRWLLGF